jgi:2,3-bisphosphoglycerate-dependent phosphoglycerate mutase
MKKIIQFAFQLPIFLIIFFFSDCQLRQASTTTFYLVRHAEKAVDGTEDPGLSDAGKQRAVKLASMLKDQNVQRLYATNYKRTQQTLQPLADSLKLEVLIYDHRDAASIERMVTDCKGKTAVIAGHSNSTPKLANILIGEEIYPELDESDYTKMWEVTKKGEKVTGHKVIVY